MATLPAATCPAGSRSCSATALLPAIADRRGECIHGACPHYKVCFVEHTIRRAADGGAGGRQPCAGDGAGGLGRARRQRGAEPLRVRRGPPRVRRGGRRVRGRAVRASRARSCAAGCWAPRAAGRARAACGGGWRICWRSIRELEAPLGAALQAARALPARRLVERGWPAKRRRGAVRDRARG